MHVSRRARVSSGMKPRLSQDYAETLTAHGYSAFLAKYGRRGLACRFISPDNVPVSNTHPCLLLGNDTRA